MRFPRFKKDIKAFLTSEEGNVNKKDIVKAGTMLFVLGMAVTGSMVAKEVSAQDWECSHTSHSSHSSHSSHGSHGSHSSHSSHGSHGSHSSHSSHGSHGSHSSHGSHGSHSSHSSHGSHGSHSSHSSHGSHGSHSSHSSHSSHGSHGSHSSHSSHGSHGSHSSHSSHGSHGSHSSHSSHGSHGSHSSCGCPFISVWSGGKRFIIDNNILSASENILRKDIIVEELYKLEVRPYQKDKRYLFRIIEFEKEHSHFYGFDLVKIIHSKEVSVGIVNNKIVAYKNLILPSSVRNKKGEDWTKKLSTLNDKIFFGGEKENVLNARFNDVQNLENCHLILRASLRANYSRIIKTTKNLEKIFSSERKWVDSLKKIAIASLGTVAAGEVIKPKDVFAAEHLCKSINIYVDIYVGNNKKGLVSIVHPRERFSLGLVDISKYTKERKGPLSLKLKWTNSHNLSFLSLVNVSSLNNSNVKQETIKLSNLKHSEDKSIDKESLKNGKVELTPGQFIELEFPAKKEVINSDQEISFILRSKGYYTPF